MIETVGEFVDLVESDDPIERRQAALEEALLPVWQELVARRADMRFWVAHNRTVPDEILRLLANDTDWRVRDRVATKHKCPADILAILASDEHEAVASTVAGHSNTPIAALRELASHPSRQVREKAASRLSTIENDTCHTSENGR